MENPLERHIQEMRDRCEENITRLRAKLAEEKIRKKTLEELLERAPALAAAVPANGGMIGHVLQMIAESDNGLSYKEIASRLGSEGWTVNEKSLQTQLLTRRRRGQLVKTDDGRYSRRVPMAVEDVTDPEDTASRSADGGSRPPTPSLRDVTERGVKRHERVTTLGISRRGQTVWGSVPNRAASSPLLLQIRVKLARDGAQSSHRVAAARRAIALRSSGSRDSARARPPARPARTLLG